MTRPAAKTRPTRQPRRSNGQFDEGPALQEPSLDGLDVPATCDECGAELEQRGWSNATISFVCPTHGVMAAAIGGAA